jgi:hypothetical protein
MTLLTEIHAEAAQLANTRVFLETFNPKELFTAEGTLIQESVNGVLDRIQHLVQSSKYGINKADAHKAAQTLASLKVIQKNQDGPKGEALKDVLSRASSADVSRGLEDAAPGTLNKIQSFVQQLVADMEGNKKQTLATIEDLRSLGPKPTDDQWAGAFDG